MPKATKGSRLRSEVMRRWLSVLIALVAVAGCSQTVDSRVLRELDRAAAQARDVRYTMVPHIPRLLRTSEPPAYSAAKLADPFYPNGSKP